GCRRSSSASVRCRCCFTANTNAWNRPFRSSWRHAAAWRRRDEPTDHTEDTEMKGTTKHTKRYPDAHVGSSLVDDRLRWSGPTEYTEGTETMGTTKYTKLDHGAYVGSSLVDDRLRWSGRLGRAIPRSRRGRRLATTLRGV